MSKTKKPKSKEEILSDWQQKISKTLHSIQDQLDKLIHEVEHPEGLNSWEPLHGGAMKEPCGVCQAKRGQYCHGEYHYRNADIDGRNEYGGYGNW